MVCCDRLNENNELRLRGGFVDLNDTRNAFIKVIYICGTLI